MGYSYNLSTLKIDKRIKKSEEIEFKVKGPFETIRSCYADAMTITGVLGDNSTAYEWMRTVASLVYDEINMYARGHKFQSMNWESEYYSIQVVMSINDVQ